MKKERFFNRQKGNYAASSSAAPIYATGHDHSFTDSLEELQFITNEI